MRRRILLLALATGLAAPGVGSGSAPVAEPGAETLRLSRKMPPDPPDPGKPPRPSRDASSRIV